MSSSFPKITILSLGKVVGILFFIIVTLSPAWAEVEPSEVDTATTREVYIVKGDLVTLKADGVTRLSLTNPEVADIIKASGKEILMVGQSVGQTTLFIWDKQGKRAVMVYVFSQNLELVKGRIEKLFEVADISEIKVEIDGQEGKVVVSGYIPKEKKERFDQIIGTFSQDVLNMVKDEEIDDLIQIDVQIAELSSTLSKNLGIEWFTGTQSTSGNNITTTSSGGLTPTYGEVMPSLDGSVGDYFKIGQFERTVNSALLAKINALLEQGKARLLSRPRLVVKSGQEASFLVGGEIPIRTSISTLTGGTGQITEQVTFKKYGISMTLTPEIDKEKIDIKLNVDLSDIDSANAVGDTVAFTSRSIQTMLYLDDGQTIVLAGLIKKNRSSRVKKVPFLGDIPVVGVLFQNKSTPVDDQDLELVISLTPTVLQKNRNGTAVASSNSAVSEDEGVVAIPPPEGQMAQEPSGGVEDVVLPPEAQPAPVQESNSLPADASSEPSPKDMDEYVRAVQQKIAQAVIYPQEAEQSGWEGTVKLGLLILNDGTLATAMVRESSGYEVLDDYTLSIAKELAPYSSFPSDARLRELNIAIPVVYSLKKN